MITYAAQFFFEPWWVQIVKALVIFLVIFGLLPVVIIYERKLLGRMQGRFGPNRVGPFGLLQPVAEIIKLATKEPFRPATIVQRQTRQDSNPGPRGWSSLCCRYTTDLRGGRPGSGCGAALWPVRVSGEGVNDLRLGGVLRVEFSDDLPAGKDDYSVAKASQLRRI